MKIVRPFSLSTYMIASVLLVHLLLAPFLYWLTIDVYQSSSSESFISNANHITGLLAEDLAGINISGNKHEIISNLDSAIMSGNIIFVDIIDSFGKTITPYDTLHISGNHFKEDKYLNQHNDGVFFISVPVFLNSTNNRSFKLRIGFDETNINEQISTIKKRIIFIMLLYILTMVSVYSIITKFINKPLTLLRQKSTHIAQGEVESPLNVPTHISDIKHLSQDLEKMRLTLLEMANHMQVQATHDELTGLPNRYLYTDRMHQAVSMAQRSNKSFAVLLLDLDRFKEINDTLGHGVGDKVLKIISDRMSDGMRDSDTIARVGGDEFSIILVDVNQDTAKIIAHKITKLIEPVINVNSHSLVVSASIGVAIYPQDGENPELLLQHADVAMYYAKHNNKQVSCYLANMDSDNYENLLLVNDLKSSISQDHFEALFQPKIDLATGEASGCELLLRWRHPYLGIIYPDKFIPLAEQENIIGDLTRWATSQSLNYFLEIIKRNPDFQVAINVSPVNLLDSKLLNSLLDILSLSEFPAHNLIIEVTENVIMKNPERSVEILNQFSDAGIKISIDDFGTGYSSLAYLQKFPITELKIDKTFITDLTKESTNYPIVKASITMAHDLGITVVAEGIENGFVHDLLTELGCDRVQGYHYGKPMAFNELELWLETEKMI